MMIDYAIYSQYHVCWWPGDTRSQGIICHGTDLDKEDENTDFNTDPSSPHTHITRSNYMKIQCTVTSKNWPGQYKNGDTDKIISMV